MGSSAIGDHRTLREGRGRNRQPAIDSETASEVARLDALGHDSKRIARKLGVTPRIVERVLAELPLLPPLAGEDSEQIAAAFGMDARRAESRLHTRMHRWLDLVRHIERGYEGGEDWANELDIRSSLEDMLDRLPPELRRAYRAILEPWDTRFRDATVEIPMPDFPRSSETYQRWDATHWWRSREPRLTRYRGESGSRT